jgi:hypothetical protein
MFLSHSSTDKEHVESVKRQLQAMGVSVYLAESDQHPGAVLNAKLKSEIELSKGVVILH